MSNKYNEKLNKIKIEIQIKRSLTISETPFYVKVYVVLLSLAIKRNSIRESPHYSLERLLQ